MDTPGVSAPAVLGTHSAPVDGGAPANAASVAASAADSAVEAAAASAVLPPPAKRLRTEEPLEEPAPARPEECQAGADDAPRDDAAADEETARRPGGGREAGGEAGAAEAAAAPLPSSPEKEKAEKRVLSAEKLAEEVGAMDAGEASKEKKDEKISEGETSAEGKEVEGNVESKHGKSVTCQDKETGKTQSGTTAVETLRWEEKISVPDRVAGFILKRGGLASLRRRTGCYVAHTASRGDGEGIAELTLAAADSGAIAACRALMEAMIKDSLEQRAGVAAPSPREPLAPFRRGVDLTVTGRRCRIHRDDGVARALAEGKHLMALDWETPLDDDWETPSRGRRGEDDGHAAAPLLVERHDARTLLDGASLPRRAARSTSAAAVAPPPSDEEGTEEEVAARNFVRYGALAERRARSRAASEARDRAAATPARSSAPEEEAPFELSEEQSRGMPPNMTLPKTQRLGAIIAQTAARIAANRQFEVFLKVKQAGNPSFAFLNPADALHPYFLHLKDTCSKETGEPEVRARRGGEAAAADDDEDAGANPLSGLLGDYASSSDDEGADPTEADKMKNRDVVSRGDDVEDDAETEEGERRQRRSDERKRKERAERVKRWKESRLKQEGENVQEENQVP